MKLKALVREFFEEFLDYTEVNSHNKEFKPIQISCCRAAKLERLDEVLTEMKRLSDATPQEWDEATKADYSAETVAKEFELSLKVLARIRKTGDIKHGKDSWLNPDNPSMQPDADFASRCRHAAKDYAGNKVDEDSGEYHFGHEALRGLMRLERLLRGIDK